MSRHIGSIQLLDGTFLLRVQENPHISHALVAIGFLKVIELICRVISGDSRNQMSRNKGESSRLLGRFFRTLKENIFPLF